jgi:hypothetical protein
MFTICSYLTQKHRVPVMESEYIFKFLRFFAKRKEVLMNIIIDRARTIEKIYEEERIKLKEETEKYFSRSETYRENNIKWKEGFKQAEKNFKEVETHCKGEIKTLLKELNYWEIFDLLLDDYKESSEKKKRFTKEIEEYVYALGQDSCFKPTRYRSKEKLQFIHAILFIIIFKIGILTADIWLEKANFILSDENEGSLAIREKINNGKHDTVKIFELEVIKRLGISGFVNEF